MSRRIARIFLHSTDSMWGDVAAVDAWHRERWGPSASGVYCGYPYLCLNGYRKGSSKGDYAVADDGAVETGRPPDEEGCHVAGANHDSLGVAFVSRGGLFTLAQVRAGVHLVRSLIQQYQLSWSVVYGHYQAESAVAQGKTCPEFRVDDFRSLLRGDG